MRIFPAGTIAAKSSNGTIDSISYSLFEPNDFCKSSRVSHILTTKFQDQFVLTRKKAEPFIAINYSYKNIFTKEFRQIEHFSEDVDDALTSFHLIDFSKGQTPSAVASANTLWTVTIDDTHLYSSVVKTRADRALLWDGINWKEGDINSITANTNIKVDVFTNNYGDLTLARANSEGMVYPLYEVYLAQNALNTFETGIYWKDNISTTDAGGYMYTGNISFVGKYKV